MTEKTYDAANAAVPDGDATAAYKTVIVTVTWPETTSAKVTALRTTTMKTIVKNPKAIAETLTTGGLGSGGGAGPWDVTVSFKYWNQVDGSGQGVSIIRQVPTPVTTLSPSKLRPTSSQQTVSWTNVPGGLGITYVVQCICDTGTYTTPPFHLLSDAPDIHFDTDPGN